MKTGNIDNMNIKKLASSSLIILLGLMFTSCANLKRVDKSYLNNAAMSLDQNRTPAFSGRGIVLNGNTVGSNTACTTCSK